MQTFLKMKKKPEIKIFFVDDDPIYTKVFVKNIEDSSYYSPLVKSFLSGEDSLRNVHERPDVIILDYYLKRDNNGLNGLETLKRLSRANPKSKVIMLTAQDDLSIAVNSIKFGAYDYVVKSETAFLKVQNAINNIMYHKLLYTKARGQKLWLKIASAALLAMVISMIAFSYLYPIG